jgi:predicted transcriptional regulator
MTGFKRSTRDAYIQRLREKGLVQKNGGKVLATADGVTALPDAKPLPVGEELQRYHLARLPSGERDILQLLIQCYPEAMSCDEITERTGFKRSTRDAYLQRMSGKEIITKPSRGTARASDTFF